MDEKHQNMDYQRYRPLVKPLVFIGIGVLFFGTAAFLVIQSGIFSAPQVEIVDETAAAASTTPQPTGILMVEVAGAVSNPGVYKLPAGARVQDALTQAGNLLPTADISFVEKSINKAAKLVDSQKIYIPEKGESAPSPVLGMQSTVSSSADVLININSASENELDTLPGVGPATAQRL